MWSILLSALLFTPARAEPECLSPQAQITPNLKLMLDFSLDLQRRNVPCERAPYAVRFKNKNYDLTFIAVDHGTGPEKASLTFQAIRAAMNAAKPNFAIVEAIPAAEGLNPRSQELAHCESTSFSDCAEMQFTGSLARQAKIPFTGSEPSDKEILATIAPRYGAKDFACLQWLSALVNRPGDYIGDQGLPPADRERKARFFRDGFAANLKETLNVDFGFEDFKRCYEKHSGHPFDPTTISSNEYRPDNSKSATYFQKIMYAADRARNPKMVHTIADGLAAYQKVLVVLGSGHLVEQKPVLEEMLGAPTYDCHPWQSKTPN